MVRLTCRWDEALKPYHIALGTIFTESNHLVGTFTDLAAFERSELRRGPAILTLRDGVVGGALHVLQERHAQVAPLLVASAYPGGILTQKCYLGLKTELLERLEQSLPVDGVLLPLHGAAAVEILGDLEGDLIREVRRRVGPAPIVVTLDCHAHVTQAMVEGADALLAWETYPHRDTYETGVRGARILFDILDGTVRPAMALAKVPVVVSGFCGGTEAPGPFADIMRLAKSWEGREGVVSTSALLVQPHLDLPDMGGGGLVIANGDLEKAVTVAGQIAEKFWQKRFDLTPEAWSPAEAIRQGLAVKGGPVLLLEVSDCVGGGASGDSAATIAALLEAEVEQPAFAMVVDPEAADRCHRAGVGTQVTLTLGHKMDRRWGQPQPVTGQVMKLTEGRFRYSGGIWSGQWGEMGPSAKLKIGVVEVLISTHATYDWADEQYRSMDMDTQKAKFIVVKNPMNYRVGYAGQFRKEFVLDTSGPTTAVLENVEFKRLRRPYYPKDKEIPDLEPVVYGHLWGPSSGNVISSPSAPQ